MGRPNRKWFVLLAAVMGSCSTAHAANLSMRFAGGGDEVTLAPGETAVISARTLGSRVEAGRETPNRVRYLRVWSKRDGVWRAVLQMAVPMAPSP